MVSVTSASHNVTQRHEIKDVHPRSYLTEFHGIGQDSSDCSLIIGHVLFDQFQRSILVEEDKRYSCIRRLNELHR